MERNESFAVANLNDLIVHMAWAQIEVFADDIEHVQVLVAGDENSVRDLRIEQNADELLVEQPQYGLSLNITDSRWMQVCIRVPKTWDKKIHVFTIGGPLSARGLTGNRIVLDTVSGDLRASRITSESLSLKTVSGDIRSDKLTAESITVRTVSGNITLEDASGKIYKCTTVSGEIKLKLKDAFTQIDLRSVSGDITLLSPVKRMSVSTRSLNGRVVANGVELSEDKASLAPPLVRVTGVSADLHLIYTEA